MTWFGKTDGCERVTPEDVAAYRASTSTGSNQPFVTWAEENGIGRGYLRRRAWLTFCAWLELRERNRNERIEG